MSKTLDPPVSRFAAFAWCYAMQCIVCCIRSPRYDNKGNIYGILHETHYDCIRLVSSLRHARLLPFKPINKSFLNTWTEFEEYHLVTRVAAAAAT